MKISTSLNDPASPLAWSALDEDTYDGAEDSNNSHMIGYGNTADEAAADLMRLLAEKAEYEQDLAEGKHAL